MARKKPELNTSCEATFKDGHTEVYNSLEEAAEKTGLSEASIKIRCNKPGSGGKDKTTFKWLDDYTTRYYRAKKSKNKGASWESEIVEKLREIGFSDACRAAGESKKLDNMKVDIAGNIPVAIQAKNTQSLPSYFKIREECPDPRPFCLLWKKAADAESNSPGSVAVIPIDLFYTMLNICKDQI